MDAADSDVVFAAHHVERIGEGPNIGPAHERRVTAIAQRPIGAGISTEVKPQLSPSQIGVGNAERLR